MGMARQAPRSTKAPRRYITNHALARLRERADVAAHIEDSALARLLDDAVELAFVRRVDADVVDDSGEDAKLVPLEFDGLTVTGSLHALIKPNLRGTSEFKEAVVTLLESRAAERVRATGSGINSAMRDQLLPLLLHPLRAAVRAAQSPPEPSQEPAPVPTPAPDKPLMEAVSAPGEYLVMDADGAVLAQNVEKDQAMGIVSDAARGSVAVYRRVRFKTRVVVDFED